jgi:NAD+ synthase (glutamine-hydrolysing)
MTGLNLHLAQIHIHPGSIGRNARAIIRAIKNNQSAHLLIFPELSLSGYLLGDMWERPSFLKECELWQQRIIANTGSTIVVFGNVITDWHKKGEDGRPLKHNCAILARAGRAIINPATKDPYFIKSLSPNYREFDESRHFCDLRKLGDMVSQNTTQLLKPVSISLNGKRLRLGITICEDGWANDYALSPFNVLASQKCDLLINISCSPFTLGKNNKRHRTFSMAAHNLNTPIVYVNAVSCQNNGKSTYTFDGSSALYDNVGHIIFQAPSFKPGIFQVNVQPGAPGKNAQSHIMRDVESNKYRDIYKALRFGIKEFMSQMGLHRVVVGVSGGIDSALTAALYGKILKPQDLLLVNMPSRYNSTLTKTLARDLAANLGCLYAEIPIEESVTLTKKQIDGIKVSSIDGKYREVITLTDFHMENIQARDRSSRVLSALASAFGGVFTCNGNKAEMTVGYATLYGDLGGYLAAIGDLWKQDVYGVADYLNQKVYKRLLIPPAVMTLPPSAELSANQNIEAGEGDPLHYEYHDRLFFSWVQNWNRSTPEETLSWYSQGMLEEKLGCPQVDVNKILPTPEAFIQDLERWWNAYSGLGVAKRIQAPPVLAVSSRAFGFDHRENLGIPFYSEAYFKLKKKLLGKHIKQV